MVTGHAPPEIVRRTVATHYARAARILGSHPVILTHEEKEAVSVHDGRPFDRPLCEWGRVALLRCALDRLPAEAHIGVIDDLYTHGDILERESLLRALSVLPDPPRFLSTAVEACRSQVRTVFEAIACDNFYPVRYFPELNFNQMVIKALFVGSPLHRVMQLSTRVSPALKRMALNFIREQSLAGRAVPDDVALLTA